MPHSGTTGAKSSSAVYSPKQTRTSFFLNIGTFEGDKNGWRAKTINEEADVVNWKMLLLAFATTFCARLTGVVTMAQKPLAFFVRLVGRRVVTRQSPITILLCRRRFQRAFNAREINRFAVIQRINPVENDKAVGVGRERSSGPIRVGTATKKREDGSNDFSLLFAARETRREELVKTSIRCQPITYRVYA